MDNNNFDNVPKPHYVTEYRKMNDIFRPKGPGDRTYLDKLIFQTFVSLIIVALVLLVNNVNTQVTNTISQSIKSCISWNMDLSKAIDTFSNIKNLIPQAQKSLGLFKSVSSESGKLTFIMPVNGTVISTFGETVHPVFKTVKMNNGIEIEAEAGTSIKSSSAGKVKAVGEDEINGKYIKITSGSYELMYAHCLKVSVKEGQQVKQGDIIGAVGDTGMTSAAKLYFEIMENGKAVNPLELINQGSAAGDSGTAPAAVTSDSSIQ